MIDQLRSIGIEKGKPFSPDANTKQALTDGIAEAHAWMAAKYDAGLPPFFEGTHWGLPVAKDTGEGLQTDFADPNAYGIDGRGVIYHFAYFSAKSFGAGQFYLVNLNDRAGNALDLRQLHAAAGRHQHDAQHQRRPPGHNLRRHHGPSPGAGM